MANTNRTPRPTEVTVTGIGSYLNLWEPKAFGTNDPKYSMVILFKKTDKKQVDAVRKAIEAAEEAAIDKVWKGKRPAKIADPVHDGDEERSDKPEYIAISTCSNSSIKTQQEKATSGNNGPVVKSTKQRLPPHMQNSGDRPPQLQQQKGR